MFRHFQKKYFNVDKKNSVNSLQTSIKKSREFGTRQALDCEFL